MTTPRWALLIVMVALLLAIGTSPRTGVSASGQSPSPLAKKKCVVKIVHGKKKRVCTNVPAATPTPKPAPRRLIDGSGYVWIEGTGNVYVSSGYVPTRNAINSTVAKLSPAGKRLATFRSKTNLDGAGGVAVDGKGNVYVSDVGSDRVVKFSRNGKEMATMGSPKSGPGELSSPEGIGLDGTGHLYVADSNNSRIQEFTLGGQFVRSIGSNGGDVGELDKALDVVLDGQGNFFVADTHNNRVEEFSSAGTAVMAWGTEGAGVGQLENPSGIALDATGNVYVADTGNRRVQKFSSTGTPLFQWSTGNYEPISLAVDASGNIYVTENQSGGAAGYGVAKYAPDGHLVSLWK